MSLNLQWYDWVGLFGVVLILLAYFVLQTGRIRGNGLPYQLMNLFGAGGVLVSLVYKPNVSAIIMEGAWVAISVYGIVRGLRAKPGAAPE
jgi:hypothetical protein